MKERITGFFKANLRWVLATLSLVIIGIAAFVGYKAYVSAANSFIFSVSVYKQFSDTTNDDAEVKIETGMNGFPNDFTYSPSLYTWKVMDDTGYPVFRVKDYTTTPGLAVLEANGAGTSKVMASYYDIYYTDASGKRVTVSPGQTTDGLTKHELSSESQNIQTITVPLRLTGYVGVSQLNDSNNSFGVLNNAFLVQYNAFTRQDPVTGDYLNDYHDVRFIYNKNVVSAQKNNIAYGTSTTIFDTIGGGYTNVWATVDGNVYKLAQDIYVPIVNTAKGDAGISVSKDKMVSLSDGYTNILPDNFGTLNADGNYSVYFWTHEEHTRTYDNSKVLIDVVDVSPTGVITGKNAGTTTVYVSCKPMSESYITTDTLDTSIATAITVTVPFEKLFEENIIVSVGDNIPILTTAYEDNVTYSMEYNNEGAIAQLNDEKGMYLAVKKGMAKVKVVVEHVLNGETIGTTEEVIVTITVIDTLTLSKTSDSVNVGFSTSVTAIPTSRDLDQVSNISWKSADESIAIVTWDKSSFDTTLNATITGVAKGKTTIYAYQTVGGVVKVATMEINVTIPVDGIELSEPQAGKQYMSMYLGQTSTIYADLQYNNNNVPDNTELVWTLSGSQADKGILKLTPSITTGVHQSCEVTANAIGSTTITVYSKDNSQVVSVDVVVTEQPTSIELSETSVVAAMSQKKHQLKAVVHSPNEGADQSVVWTSLDTSVCTVDPDTGLVTFKKPGTTYICATSTVDPTVTAYCYFEIAQDVYGIILDTTDLTLKVGETYRITASVNPADAYDKTMVWKSTNPDVIKVENTNSYENLLTATGSGSASIIAETNDGGYIAYCNVRVLQPVTSIEISQSEITVRKGTEFYLNATPLPDDADDKTIVWSCNDTEIATVSEDGKVATLKVGQCIITATNPDSGVSVACVVNVLEPITGLTLNTYYQNMVKGTRFVLIPYVEPTTASNKDVTFWSSDLDVATVDEKGIITAVNGGTCEIVVTTVESSFVAKCTIDVKEYVSSIQLPFDFKYLNFGDLYKMTAEVGSKTASNKALVWTSSDTGIVTVDENGVIKGVGYGRAIITATAADGSGVSASCIIQVVKPVTEIILDKQKATMYVGDIIHINATVKPADASVQKLTWTSSDPSIARVYDDGDVEAISVGRCKIYVTSTDGNDIIAECTIIVKQIVQATSLTLNSHEILMLRGKMRQLSARLYPLNATEGVHWYSTDTSIVQVDDDGWITTVGAGVCEVIAYTYYGTIEDKCLVYSMAISQDSITIEQYDTFQLYVDGAPKAASWRTSNPRIATISSNGLVTARMPGECTISATVDGKTVTCFVSVRSVDPDKFINPINQ